MAAGVVTQTALAAAAVQVGIKQQAALASLHLPLMRSLWVAVEPLGQVVMERQVVQVFLAHWSRVLAAVAALGLALMRPVERGVRVAALAARLPDNLVPLEQRAKVIQVVAQQAARLMEGLEVAGRAQRAGLQLKAQVYGQAATEEMVAPHRSAELPFLMRAAVAVGRTETPSFRVAPVEQVAVALARTHHPPPALLGQQTQAVAAAVAARTLVLCPMAALAAPAS